MPGRMLLAQCDAGLPLPGPGISYLHASASERLWVQSWRADVNVALLPCVKCGGFDGSRTGMVPGSLNPRLSSSSAQKQIAMDENGPKSESGGAVDDIRLLAEFNPPTANSQPV